MIAAGFLGVKARNSLTRHNFDEALGPGFARRLFVGNQGFLRKETVRFSLHVLNSPRINRSRGQTVKEVRVRRFPSQFKSVMKSPHD